MTEQAIQARGDKTTEIDDVSIQNIKKSCRKMDSGLNTQIHTQSLNRRNEWIVYWNREEYEEMFDTAY